MHKIMQTSFCINSLKEPIDILIKGIQSMNKFLKIEKVDILKSCQRQGASLHLVTPFPGLIDLFVAVGMPVKASRLIDFVWSNNVSQLQSVCSRAP